MFVYFSKILLNIKIVSNNFILKKGKIVSFPLEAISLGCQETETVTYHTSLSDQPTLIITHTIYSHTQHTKNDVTILARDYAKTPRALFDAVASEISGLVESAF